MFLLLFGGLASEEGHRLQSPKQLRSNILNYLFYSTMEKVVNSIEYPVGYFVLYVVNSIKSRYETCEKVPILLNRTKKSISYGVRKISPKQH